MQAHGLLTGPAPLCRNQQKCHTIPAAFAHRLNQRVNSNSLACSPSATYSGRQRVQAAAASATLEDLSFSSSKDDSRKPSGKSGLDDVSLTSEVLSCMRIIRTPEHTSEMHRDHAAILSCH